MAKFRDPSTGKWVPCEILRKSDGVVAWAIRPLEGKLKGMYCQTTDASLKDLDDVVEVVKEVKKEEPSSDGFDIFSL